MTQDLTTLPTHARGPGGDGARRRLERRRQRHNFRRARYRRPLEVLSRVVSTAKTEVETLAARQDRGRRAPRGGGGGGGPRHASGSFSRPERHEAIATNTTWAQCLGKRDLRGGEGAWTTLAPGSRTVPRSEAAILGERAQARTSTGSRRLRPRHGRDGRAPLREPLHKRHTRVRQTLRYAGGSSLAAPDSDPRVFRRRMSTGGGVCTGGFMPK